jgi:hypothetical protein
MKKTISFLFLILFFKLNSSAQFVSGKLSKIKILPEQTVSIILTSNDTLNAEIKETVKLNWKVCKYEFVTLDEIAEKGKLGDYYLTVIDSRGANSSGYSTNSAYTEFGKSKNDIEKACKKFKKDKEEGLFFPKLRSLVLVRAFLDPSMIHNNFSHMGGGGIAFNIKEKIGSTLKPDEFTNAVKLNLKTINWLLNTNLQKYFKKGSGKTVESSAVLYNSNSCELKNMILLVSASDSINGKKFDFSYKNFELSEFKKYYPFEVSFATPAKIAEYLHNDTENKYALLVQGVSGRAPVVLIFRISDGAILYGFPAFNAVVPGYTKRIYKKFAKVCN